MKDVLVSSIADHFSDYSLEWGLGVDASNVAIGAVLCQIRVAEDCTKTYEAIGLASKKFSDAAKSWDTMKKEYYACYFGIFIFAYYLRGKSFILKTYHNNILLIEKSLLPIVTH